MEPNVFSHLGSVIWAVALYKCFFFSCIKGNRDVQICLNSVWDVIGSIIIRAVWETSSCDGTRLLVGEGQPTNCSGWWAWHSSSTSNAGSCFKHTSFWSQALWYSWVADTTTTSRCPVNKQSTKLWILPTWQVSSIVNPATLSYMFLHCIKKEKRSRCSEIWQNSDKWSRDDEFDLDLEDIMVMEAIWLSIQVFSQLLGNGFADLTTESWCM